MSIAPTSAPRAHRFRSFPSALSILAVFTHVSLLMATATVALAQTPGAAPPGMTGMPGADDNPPMRPITEAEIGPYLDALRELAKLGVQFEGAGGDEAGYADAVMFSERAQESLTSRGFTAESFTSIHWNVMMAYTALKMKDQEGKIAEAQKEQAAALEEMRSQMSPEQFAQMKQMMSGIDSMVSAYRDVPPANIALVTQHLGELEAIVSAPR